MSKKTSPLLSAWIKYFQKGEWKTNEIIRLRPNQSQKELPGMVYSIIGTLSFNYPKPSHFSFKLRNILQLKGAIFHAGHFCYLWVRTHPTGCFLPPVSVLATKSLLTGSVVSHDTVLRITCYWNEMAYFRQSAYTKVCLQILN